MKKFIIAAAIAATLTGMSSCSGLLMSSDFGFGDYGPSGDIYFPNYGNVYNPPLGYYGPAWGAPTPPPPPPVVVKPAQRPNGSNRPNYTPPQPNQGQNNPPVVTTQPNGQQRPGNMGQGPTQNNQNNSGSSGTHRGR